MGVSVTELRANIYKLIDEVIETGVPLEIERKGVVVRLVPPEGRDLEALFPKRGDLIMGDPDELIHMDWYSEWNPEPNQ